MNTIDTVTAYIEQYHLLPAESTIVVALSGGADSLCLLHMLCQLCGPGKYYPTVKLHVAHLNHMLRGTASTQDALAVARIVASWQLSSTIEATDVPALAQQEQRSIEDAARIARYHFLRSVAQSLPAPVYIAVAHHKDDQAETLILHWLRGGGITSVVGLQPRQQDIIRPLLSITHADTLAYCQQHNLIPLEDESNTDIRYLRNRIRHELLPSLEAINPGIRATLLRNAEVMQVDAAWIDTQVFDAWPAVITVEQDTVISLRRNALLALPLSLQRHLLRHVSARLNAGQSPFELRHYKLINQLLEQESNGTERTLHLPERIHMVCKGESVVFMKNVLPITQHITHSWQGEEAILTIPGRVAVPGTRWVAVAEIISDIMLQTTREALQCEDWNTVWRVLASDRYGTYIDGDCVNHTLRVRTRRTGDRIRPLGMTQEKKIQDILINKHIARSEREQIPLFCADAHCIWLAGVSLDDRARLRPTTRTIVRLSIVMTNIANL